MQQARLRSTLPMACPECETELHGDTGICPACLWHPSQAMPSAQAEEDDQRSFSERHGGARTLSTSTVVDQSGVGLARGRLFVVIGLVASVLLAMLLWETLTFI